MSNRIDGSFIIVRHPTSQGAIVKKIDAESSGSVRLDERVLEYDDFVVQVVSSRSALRDHVIDRSGLSDEELEILRYE